jgi:Rubrerythrin
MVQNNKNPTSTFSEEVHIHHEYLVYASQAEKEGMPQVAKIFRAIAAAESIIKNSGKSGEAVINSQNAVNGGTGESAGR